MSTTAIARYQHPEKTGPFTPEHRSCVFCIVCCETFRDMGKSIINGCVSLKDSIKARITPRQAPPHADSATEKQQIVTPAHSLEERIKDEKAHVIAPSTETMTDDTMTLVKTSKYVNQIIFNFLNVPYAVWWNGKAKSQNLPSLIIDFRKRIGDLELTEEDMTLQFRQLCNLTHASRIEIFAHGGILHPDAVSSDPDDRGDRVILTVDAFVRILKTYASQLIKKDDGQRIKISVNTCFSASSSGEECFTLCLSRALDQGGIPAEVVGRVGLVCSNWDFEHNKSFKTTYGRHHHTGDKISTVTIDGVTTSAVVQYASTLSDISASSQNNEP